MPPRRPLRVKGFSYVGVYRYSLRFCTYGRYRYFTRRELVEAVTLQISRTCRDEGFEILAYCYMPDHLHLVAEGLHDGADLRRLVKISKQRVAYVFRREFGIPLTWQEGYYERVLRSDEATEVVIRYVLDNPVRGGLVEKPEDYPYSGALYWPV